MSYKDFNKWVKNYYEENLIQGQINTLTIPSIEIEEYLNSNNEIIENWSEVNSDSWSYLLNTEGVPKFLGLIALQCHAAFKMHNDGDVTAANFSKRFKSLLGIVDKAKLNQLFSEEYDNKLNIQEKIWQTTALFFKRNNIFIEIPEVKSYAGRNTQYPISQCIINYQDLEEYLPLYEKINSNYDVIHFEEFILEYNKSFTKLNYSFKRENNKKTVSESENKIKLKQIFDYFVSNVWIDIQPKKNEINQNSRIYHILLKGEVVEIYDDNYEVVSNITKLFSNNKILFFQEDVEYKNEFKIVKKIEKNSKYLVLVENKFKQLNEMDKRFQNNRLNTDRNNISCYLINLNENLPDFLMNYLGKEYPIKLLGKKVSQKRQFFSTNPPQIFSKNNIPSSLYLNNVRVQGEKPIKTGKYIIKVNGYSN